LGGMKGGRKGMRRRWQIALTREGGTTDLGDLTDGADKHSPLPPREGQGEGGFPQMDKIPCE